MKALYFAWVRERVGKAEEELDPPADVADRRRPHRMAFAARARATPTRSKSRATVRAALDRVHASDDAPIAGARESRLLSADDRRLEPMATVRVQREDFDAAAEAEALARGRTDVGAVVSFVGLCRDEGGALAALELEHYPGMAEEEIARAAARG